MVECLGQANGRFAEIHTGCMSCHQTEHMDSRSHSILYQSCERGHRCDLARKRVQAIALLIAVEQAELFLQAVCR